jgi:hypothetical protein
VHHVIQLAQKIGQHVAELRLSKEPLQLPVILGFLQELTSHVTLGSDVQPWDVIGMFVTRLSNDVNALLPQVQQSITDQRLMTSKPCCGIAGYTSTADVLTPSLCRTAMGCSSEGDGKGSQCQFGCGGQVAAAGGTDYFSDERSEDQGRSSTLD